MWVVRTVGFRRPIRQVYYAASTFTTIDVFCTVDHLESECFYFSSL